MRALRPSAEESMKHQWSGLGTGLLLGLLVAGVIAAAPTKVAAPVEVVNFPAVQSVDGTVNVGNFPVVQGVEVHGQVPVTGQVDVANLPLDGEGNLRITGYDSRPESMDMELRLYERDRLTTVIPNIRPFPPIALPSGFSVAIVSMQSVDTTRGTVISLSVGFGTGSAPAINTHLGQVQLLPLSPGLEGGSNQTSNGLAWSSSFRVSGPFMQLLPNVQEPSGDLTPPPDTEYYVHIHLTN
jgi:hypothetical protein